MDEENEGGGLNMPHEDGEFPDEEDYVDDDIDCKLYHFQTTTEINMFKMNMIYPVRYSYSQNIYRRRIRIRRRR